MISSSRSLRLHRTTAMPRGKRERQTSVHHASRLVAEPQTDEMQSSSLILYTHFRSLDCLCTMKNFSGCSGGKCTDHSKMVLAHIGRCWDGSVGTGKTLSLTAFATHGQGSGRISPETLFNNEQPEKPCSTSQCADSGAEGIPHPRPITQPKKRGISKHGRAKMATDNRLFTFRCTPYPKLIKGMKTVGAVLLSSD